MPSAVGEVRTPGSLCLRPRSARLSRPTGLAWLPRLWSGACGEARKAGWARTRAGAREWAADPAVLPQPTPPPPPVPPTKQQYLCQPLLDAVLANIRSPVFNHSLYRTFVPAMTAIHGPPVTCVPAGLGGRRARPRPGRGVNTAASCRAPVVSTRKRKFEEDERQSIPNVLQGEVARLDPKFLVNLDPSHCSNDGAVHLICKLGERWAGAAGTACRPSPALLESARCPPRPTRESTRACLGAGSAPARARVPPRHGSPLPPVQLQLHA